MARQPEGPWHRGGQRTDERPIGLFGAILLTMANGADNISVCILEFSSYNAGIT